MLRKVKNVCFTGDKMVIGNNANQKVKVSLLQSWNTETYNITVNEFSNLPNLAWFHIMFDEDGLCRTKWLEKKTFERSRLFEFFSSYVDTSKQKK